jgi:predicted nuclease with TOPRIM domain
MDDGPESLTLRYLRQISAQLGELREDMREIKGRLGNLEEHNALLARAYASLSNRMDRFDERLGRIERRLELREPADA